MGILKVIGSIFSPVKELIGEAITDKDQRNQLLAQIDLAEMEMQREILREQGQTLRAEIAGNSWLQRNWRPITMLGFLGCVMGHWFGLTPDTLTPEAVTGMFTLVQIGLGGYVAGRTVEKVLPTVMKNKRDA